MRFATLLAAVTFAACSGSSGSTGSLTGSQSFPVASTQLSEICGACGADSSGAPSAMAVFLGDRPLASVACVAVGADGGIGGGDAGPIQIVQLQLAAPGLATCSGGSASGALAAGTFPIVDEGVTDAEVCGNLPAGTQGAAAVLVVETCNGLSGCNVSDWAVAGSATLSAVSATSASGTFDVFLGNATVPDAGELKGTFTAASCG
ncbi:MAG TPA: hypothetical protein VMB50_13050 [Myxococcales bacterium]|nr:hypothetical protein [Myxococcales bacterium]